MTHASRDRPLRWAAGLRFGVVLAVWFVVATGLAVGAATPPDPGFDRYGGWRGISSSASGRFRVERISGVWWLITREGNAFFSAGVDHTRPEGDYAPALGRYPYYDNVLARYGTEAAWADVVVARFADLGFNTLGAWSKTEAFPGRIAYTVILNFSGHAPVVPGVPAGPNGFRVRDYFSPDFVSGAAAEAAGSASCAADPFCIGVFSDNEVGWGPGVAQQIPTFDDYLLLPAGAPGKLALQAFLSDRYNGNISAFNATWVQQLTTFDDLQTLTSLSPDFRADPPNRQADRRAFQGLVASRYFEVVHEALRAVSPTVLILGARFLAYSTSGEVAIAAAPFVDVLSVNYYEVAAVWFDFAQELARQYGYLVPERLFDDLDEMARLTGKPLLISEFTYRAADSGLPNTFPPFFPVLATQTERADGYGTYLRRVLTRPYLVGAHWFEHCDEPATGRFDGENNNFGIVDINDDPWTELNQRMRTVNRDAAARRLLLAGGGGTATDCAVEFAASAAPVMRKGRAWYVCTDGDAACDLDAVSGQCVFEVLPCAQVADRRLSRCVASMPTSIVVEQPTATADATLQSAFSTSLATMLAAPPDRACGTAVTVSVPLGNHRRARRVVRLVADGPTGRDRDTLRFICRSP